jgi:hypothetical protein
MLMPRGVTYEVDGRGCFICTSHRRNRAGYPEIKRERRHTSQGLHRFIFETWNGPLTPGLVVRHTCDNPGCINPSHLVGGTHADNVGDRVQRERSARGERNGRALLTAGQVREVRESTESGASLARRFGVHPSTIYLIRGGKNWRGQDR